MDYDKCADDIELYDIYYMDVYNNILSSSISIPEDEVLEIQTSFKENYDDMSVHYIYKNRVDLTELFYN